MEKNQSNNRTYLWKGICIGAILMLLILIAFYFVDQYVLRSPILPPLQLQKESSATNDTLVQIVENNHYYYQQTKKQSPHTTTDTTEADTLLTETNPEDNLQDDEFFFDYSETDETNNIYHNQVLAIRKIKVQTLHNELDSTLTVRHFDVEQLSEAIKNKYSYQREGNNLKIKGLDIQNINILYYNHEFFIEKNGHYYAIPENMRFDRLQERIIKN